MTPSINLRRIVSDIAVAEGVTRGALGLDLLTHSQICTVLAINSGRRESSDKWPVWT